MKISRGVDDFDDRALLADVAFNRHSMQDGEHVSPFDNNTAQIGADGIEVALVQGIDEEAFRRTLSAATRATIGIDIGLHWVVCEDPPAVAGQMCSDLSHREHKPRDHDWQRDDILALVDPLDNNSDWEEMMKGGLQTALETQVIVFAVKGVSRTCTHQLVRSRRASFHQQSQRASYMGDHPEVRIPESVWRNPAVRDAWLHAINQAHAAYRAAAEADISYQDARFILPEGTTNFIMLEYPVREFLNVYAYRGCSMFQWEIVDVMRKCRQLLVMRHPWIEPYVKISCEKTKGAIDGPTLESFGEDQGHQWTTDMLTSCSLCGISLTRWHDEGSGPCPQNREYAIALSHHCTFQGWEEVTHQCDFPWARETNRTFRSDAHAIVKKPSESGGEKS